MSSDQRKELAAIRKEAKRRGWRLDQGKKYWKMYCPPKCGKHIKTMHLSPSDPNYARNLLGQLGRATCWNDQEDREAEEDAK